LDYQCSPALVDEYIKNDNDRANGNQTYPTVYDYVDISPYYDGLNEVYIDEREAIELPVPSQ